MSPTVRVDLARPLRPIAAADDGAPTDLVVALAPRSSVSSGAMDPSSPERPRAHRGPARRPRPRAPAAPRAPSSGLRTAQTADHRPGATVVITARGTGASGTGGPSAAIGLASGRRPSSRRSAGASGLSPGELARVLDADRSSWVAFTTDAATPEPTWLTGLPARGGDSLLACLTGFTAAPPAPPRLDLGPRRVLSTVSLAADVASTPESLAELLARRRTSSSGGSSCHRIGRPPALERPAQLLHDVLREGFRVVYDPARAVFADVLRPCSGHAPAASERPAARPRRRSRPSWPERRVGRRSRSLSLLRPPRRSPAPPRRARTADAPIGGVRGRRRPDGSTDGSQAPCASGSARSRAGCSTGRTGGRREPQRGHPRGVATTSS